MFLSQPNSSPIRRSGDYLPRSAKGELFGGEGGATREIEVSFEKGGFAVGGGKRA